MRISIIAVLVGSGLTAPVSALAAGAVAGPAAPVRLAQFQAGIEGQVQGELARARRQCDEAARTPFTPEQCRQWPAERRGMEQSATTNRRNGYVQLAATTDHCRAVGEKVYRQSCGAAARSGTGDPRVADAAPAPRITAADARADDPFGDGAPEDPDDPFAPRTSKVPPPADRLAACGELRTYGSTRLRGDLTAESRLRALHVEAIADLERLERDVESAADLAELADAAKVFAQTVKLTADGLWKLLVILAPLDPATKIQVDAAKDLLQYPEFWRKTIEVWERRRDVNGVAGMVLEEALKTAFKEAQPKVYPGFDFLWTTTKNAIALGQTLRAAEGVKVKAELLERSRQLRRAIREHQSALASSSRLERPLALFHQQLLRVCPSPPQATLP